ncbi:MAG: 4Fe-4S binding protein [Deltaproteobacteria bacterium]|nr:4Fe-4S binding protein [Deltaproteobacteria bacterium]
MSKKDKIHLIIDGRCKSCGLCVAACPKQTLAIGSALNHQGYAYVTQIAPDKCVKCNICRVVCPDVAICVIDPQP